MNAGDTFFYKGPKSQVEHLYVVVSDPNGAQIVVVNFTTVVGGPVQHDPSCVVESNEHPWLAHRSWMMYINAITLPGPNLRSAYPMAGFRKERPCSEVLLKKIRDGAMASDQTPAKCKTILRDQGLADDSA